MKKLRVNKKYGEWYYDTYKDYNMEFSVYEVTNGKESYKLESYADVMALVKEPTKENREKFERIYG